MLPCICAMRPGLHMDFQGFVEADKINRGECDVVVCDGFTGNIALKSIEGTAPFRNRSAAPRVYKLIAVKIRLSGVAPRD